MSSNPPDSGPEFLAIVGPTASGKTSLSLDVGRALDGEVVSMDSRQIYRGMDIGTGKVTLRERALLPHHGLDLLDPDERYSAGRFARDARGWIRDIRGRSRVPLLVGGTGFFLRALTEPMFSEPSLEPDRLEALREHLNEMSADGLRRWAEALDPEGTGEGGEGGKHRLTRKIEVALLTGRPLSWWHRVKEASEEPLEGVVVLLDLPRELLHRRINARVGRMVEEGLVKEVESLLEAGYGSEDPGMTGSGYREIVQYLRGEMGLEEATERIRTSHRQYARRQATWFRHQLPDHAVTLNGNADHDSQVRRITELWTRREKGRA